MQVRCRNQLIFSTLGTQKHRHHARNVTGALRGKRANNSPPVTAVGNLEVARTALFRWTVRRGEVSGVLRRC
jgi:hypothetical protein